MTAKRRSRAKSPFLPSRAGQAKLEPTSGLAMALRELPDASGALDGPVLQSDLPVQIPGLRVELTQEQIDNAVETLKVHFEKNVDPYAENSRRGMRSDWRHWAAFCAQRDRVAMPISFEDLSEFIDALIDAGYQRASLEHILFTLGEASRFWQCPNPTDTHLWKDLWRDRRRNRLNKRQHQAASINTEEVELVRESINTDDARSIRDAAFVACAYDMLARSSEMVAMLWENITFDVDEEGGATYLLDSSKTDQEGVGEMTYLTPETATLLRAWNEHRDQENTFVFHALPRFKGQRIDTTRPLNVREVSRIYERVSKKNEIAKALSGHSARVGAAQDMTRAGMDLAAIMQAGRWKTPQMPARYAERELAARAGKNRRDALRKLKR
ncbi:tyrosine-type recombinase/integrase [Luteimonas sp. MHLX1A]|uniref:tyrosine-type recombinase/integrase n=1 Tax=Alterluteimonas muca TaxID=2878684 RepID=UPI001E634303|nr:tyrosine-type recombinase/integrase [Luteimonas sp. MHLX1A]MCD9046862.1 tyrosine-type recombinase/integrase [Luteimonas sp. MHLX1A]